MLSSITLFTSIFVSSSVFAAPLLSNSAFVDVVSYTEQTAGFPICSDRTSSCRIYGLHISNHLVRWNYPIDKISEPEAKGSGAVILDSLRQFTKVQPTSITYLGEKLYKGDFIEFQFDFQDYNEYPLEWRLNSLKSLRVLHRNPRLFCVAPPDAQGRRFIAYTTRSWQNPGGHYTLVIDNNALNAWGSGEFLLGNQEVTNGLILQMEKNKVTLASSYDMRTALIAKYGKAQYWEAYRMDDWAFNAKLTSKLSLADLPKWQNFNLDHFPFIEVRTQELNSVIRWNYGSQKGGVIVDGEIAMKCHQWE